jgi:hypothetical protein
VKSALHPTQRGRSKNLVIDVKVWERTANESATQECLAANCRQNCQSATILARYTETNLSRISQPAQNTSRRVDNGEKQNEECLPGAESRSGTVRRLKWTVYYREEEQKQNADRGAADEQPAEHPRQHMESMIQSC